MLCLESLEQALQNLRAEIIVVDNASGDETEDLVKTHFPHVNYIQSETNDGFSMANNKGIAQAKGEFVFLINPDTVISENAIAEAIKKHKAIENCGILGVQLIDGTGHFLPESKINRLSLTNAAFKFLGYSKSFYNHSIAADGEGETATLVGAFMCFTKEQYKKVEGLDDNYFMYGEDIDLSFQFVKKGFKNYYLGNQSIIHFKGESTLKDKAYFKRFFTSVKYYFEKHYTNSSWIVGLLSLFFFIAKWTKRSDIAKKQRRDVSFNSIYCLTKSDVLINKLSTHFKQEIIKIDKDSIREVHLENDYIVFDKNYLSVAEIIRLMKSCSNHENYFRIRSSTLDVLIGSDSSTSQGEVIRF